MSDVPFTLVLRQYRGIQRQDWSKLKSWDLLGSHIDMTVDGSVSLLLDKLEAKNMLTMPEVQGLPNPRQQPGFRRYAFIQEPDGLVIENFGKPAPQPGDPPAAPVVSNSSATPQNIDRLGKQAGLQSFRPECGRSRRKPGIFMRPSWAATIRPSKIPAQTDSAKRLVPAGHHPKQPAHRAGLFYGESGQDASANQIPGHQRNYSGFQVSNIASAYARAKQNGAITVTEGGIVPFHKGRAVLIRDSDVGGISCSGSLPGKDGATGKRFLVLGLIHFALDAGELEMLEVLIENAAVEVSDGPRPSVVLGIVDGGLVLKIVGIDGRNPLDDVNCVAMQVRRLVHPGARHLIGHVDDQGVAVPLPARIALPQVDAGATCGRPSMGTMR